MDTVSVFWFRRDLRLEDNAGLWKALKSGQAVLPIFVFDRNILDKLEDRSDARVSFLHDRITALDQELQVLGSSLKVFYSTPMEAMEALSNAYDVRGVYINRDYDPYASARDTEVFKYWRNYPIDKWVFYDDNSTDDTVAVIKSLFGDHAVVFEGKREEFSESHNRSMMLEFSRGDKADFVLSIDADELLSTSWLENWDHIAESNCLYDVEYFWYNVVGSVKKTRQDPMYQTNYRTFLLPMRHTGKFDLLQYKYHTPRTPQIKLNKARCREAGVIHLQAINKRYYALKQ